MYSIETLDPLLTPVPAEDLVDWARLDSDDPKIESCLLIATSQVISFLQLELLPRTFTLIHQDWPIVGTVSCPSLSRNNYAHLSRIDLPFTNLVSITSVKVGGDLITTDDYSTIPGKPYQIEFDQIVFSDDDNPAIEIVYVAGYENFSKVPEPIKQAIKIVATFIHANSGGCDSSNAVNKSGASELLRQYAVMGGLVF